MAPPPAKALNTSWMGLAELEVAFPPYNRPTGRAVSVVTTREPESPIALKLPPLMMTWLLNVEVNAVAPPQDTLYTTLTSVLIDDKVEQVSPVLRPLLATPSLLPSTVAGLATVLEGAAAAMPVEPTAPRSRMLPDVSTVPEETICAMAASTLLGEGPQGDGCPAQIPVVLVLVGLSAAAFVRFATKDPPLQLLST